MLNATLLPLLVALASDPMTESTLSTGEDTESTSNATERSGGAWAAGYDKAKAAMIAGRFDEAAAAFSRLVQTATNRVDRTLAFENAAICREWVERGVSLVTQDAAQQQGGPRANRRTLDELAVLYTTSVLYGLGAGVSVAVLADADSPAGVVLPMLGAAGLSAGAVALLDHQLELRYGVPQSIVSGMMIGLEEGIAWAFWNQARVDHSDEWSGKALAGLLWGTTTAGAIAGGVLGSRFGTTPGRASFVGSAALWSGLVAGLVVGAIGSGDKQDDYAMLAAALALNAGAVTGVLVGASASPSIARVRFLDLGGIAGGVLFGGLCLAAQGDSVSGETLMGVTGLGIAAGLAASWALTSRMVPDHGPDRASDSVLSRLTPTLVPATNGTGLVLGLGGTI